MRGQRRYMLVIHIQVGAAAIPHHHRGNVDSKIMLVKVTHPAFFLFFGLAYEAEQQRPALYLQNTFLSSPGMPIFFPIYLAY